MESLEEIMCNIRSTLSLDEIRSQPIKLLSKVTATKEKAGEYEVFLDNLISEIFRKKLPAKKQSAFLRQSMEIVLEKIENGEKRMELKKLLDSINDLLQSGIRARSTDIYDGEGGYALQLISDTFKEYVPDMLQIKLVMDEIDELTIQSYKEETIVEMQIEKYSSDALLKLLSQIQYREELKKSLGLKKQIAEALADNVFHEMKRFAKWDEKSALREIRGKLDLWPTHKDSPFAPLKKEKD